MMKRTGVPRLGPDDPSPLQPQVTSQMQQAGASNMHTLAQSAQPQILGGSMVSVGGGFSRRAASPAVINYLKSGAVQYAAPKQPPPQPPQPPRLKQPSLPPAPPLGGQSPGAAAGPPPAQFQRLKVEDALSYLDQVKFKFNNQPQVYNDFLDIMKEFKSQSIDTPGVITRVSNLFKGHPELIVGFNTFLPPGYKIEVQSNGQVSVSMPSPTGVGAPGVLLGVHHAPPQPQLVHLLPVAQPVSSAIVHKLAVTAAPATTMHHAHIATPHRQLEAPTLHHAQAAAQQAAQPPPAPPGQPVEFNHAIEYVNKIKSRFSRQPDKYKRFLEILHAYQRGHRDLKEPHAKQQTEQEVYSQVAKLFENQEDLLAEFGQFLPDAKQVTKPPPVTVHHQHQIQQPAVVEHAQPPVETEVDRFPPAPSSPPHHLHHQLTKQPAAPPSTAPPSNQHHHLKRSPSFTSSTQLGSSAGAPPAKKPRAWGSPAWGGGVWGGALRDVSYAEAAKLATLHDLNFFDRVRKALRSQHVYENFLKCLLLYTSEVLSASELVTVTQPFLCRHPELHRHLQHFLAPIHPPSPGVTTPPYASASNTNLCTYPRERLADAKPRYESIGTLRNDRPKSDHAMDIDLNTCKRLGTSYVALPKEAASRKCSGRTALCKEVLNDTWVSFPTWSEDSTFVTSRKTQYEEYIYRCEDERFELDVVIETNASTIRVLEGVQKKLSRMSAEEAARYRLDDCLGGHSPTIHQRALRRIYGDKAVDIIAGLKKNPVVAVPVVLRRLKAKEEEWRDAQKGFNKQWREQNEKYYLKSLDHQGINFKQNDLKAMRSKSLFNEVESAYAAGKPGPHLVVDYNMQSRQEAIKILADAAELLIHHARRQTAIQKAEKRRIKQLLRQFIPDLFAHPRQPLSDDERDDEEKDEPASPDSSGENADEKGVNTGLKQESSESDNGSDKSSKNNKNDKENKPKNNNTADKDTIMSNNLKRSSSNEEPTKQEIKQEHDIEDDYRDHPPNESVFVCTSSWYVFLRVHGAVCQRLVGARRAAAAAAGHGAGHNAGHNAQQEHPPAHALRLKPHNLPADVTSPSEYYGALLELVRGVLDGNVEPSAYEDAAREMLGIRAYPLYTLDKLVSIAVRQLQHCVSEPWSVRATELCRGRRAPAVYVRRAAAALANHHAAFLVKVYGGDDCKVTFELLEGHGDGRSSPQHNIDSSRLSPTNQTRCPGGVARGVASWSLYTERYARPDAVQHSPNKPVFLRRNLAPHHTLQSLNVAATVSTGSRAHSHNRRKPPRINDHSECTVGNAIRLVAGRAQQLYRAGALRAARASHPRLHAARRARFRAWLRTRT